MKHIVSHRPLFKGPTSSSFPWNLDGIRFELPLIKREAEPSAEEKELSSILKECEASGCSSFTGQGCNAYADIFAKWSNGKRCPRAFRPGKDKGRF